MENDTKTTTIKLTCPHCGEEFEATVYTAVDVTGNKELLKKVINYELDFNKCPCCGKDVANNCPFEVIDADKNVVVKCEPEALLIHEWFNGVKEEKGMYLEPIEVIGAVSLADRNEKLIAIKHNLDYRLATLYLTYRRIGYATMLREEFGKGTKFDVKVYLQEDDNEQLQLLISLDYTKEGQNEEHRETIDEFVMEDYEKIATVFKDELENGDVFDYYFDQVTAYKFMHQYGKEPRNMVIAEVYVPHETDIVFAEINSYNLSKYNEGDRVVVRFGNTTKIGFIDNIYHTTNKEMPMSEKRLGKVMWHYTPTTLTTSGSSGDDLDNDILLEVLKDEHDSGGKSVALSNADVITLVTAIISAENIEKALQTDTLTNDMVNMEFKKVEVKSGTYLCVYTHQDKRDYSQPYSDFIYKFDDLVRLVLSEPVRYTGIVINAGTDNYVLNQRRLLEYLYEQVMCDKDKMIDLFGKLTNEEKDFIGDYYYDLITEPYLSDHKWNPEETGKRWNKTKEDIENDIDIGYERLMEVVQDNYK